MIELRDYQRELADRVRQAYAQGAKAPILALPTGGGKTIIFAYITASADGKGKSVFLLCHRSELIKQISTALAKFDVTHRVIAPPTIIRQCKVKHFLSFKKSFVGESRIYVASVQTLVRRMGSIAEKPDMIICDEAHHLTHGSTWGKICANYPDAKILGVTATPCRLDGKGLGIKSGGFSDLLIQGNSMRWLIDNGHLSEYRIFAPPNTIDLSTIKMKMGDYDKVGIAEAVDKPTITGDAIQHYVKLCAGKRAIVFCISVKHAEHVAAEFKAAGIPAASLDGTMDAAEREKTISKFESGETMVMTSCDIVSEGFDLPAIECAILLRPTQSTALYLQQVGRALRTYDGKTHAVILDHVGNVARHGLPDAERPWSLDGLKKRKRKEVDEAAVNIRSCPTCFFIHKPAPFCPACGHPYDGKDKRKIDVIAGELVEITEAQKLELRRIRKKEERDCKTLNDFIELGKSRHYKFPTQWAEKRFYFRSRVKG